MRGACLGGAVGVVEREHHGLADVGALDRQRAQEVLEPEHATALVSPRCPAGAQDPNSYHTAPCVPAHAARCALACLPPAQASLASRHAMRQGVTAQETRCTAPLQPCHTWFVRRRACSTNACSTFKHLSQHLAGAHRSRCTSGSGRSLSRTSPPRCAAVWCDAPAAAPVIGGGTHLRAGARQETPGQGSVCTELVQSKQKTAERRGAPSTQCSTTYSNREQAFFNFSVLTTKYGL